MLKKISSLALTLLIVSSGQLFSHCQMPCGIYHDEMVFDQIDQYVETMAKAVTVLEENTFKNVQDKNTVIRWVMEKENASDEIAHVITDYFLQQKIKVGGEDTTERLISAHKLLFYLMKIKQNVDISIVDDFYQEWERFKLMFHIEGYKCKVEQGKLKKWRQENAGKPMKDHLHDDDDHDHDHDEGGHSHTH